VCGDELEGHDYGGGTVWTCDVHGVRDWFFEHPGKKAASQPGDVVRVPSVHHLPAHGKAAR
jgi:hypothetical protein